MNEILRNILRRKIRSFLTIFGIAIGIFALTVMGSMSEYFNTLVERSLRYSAEVVRVYPKASIAGPTSGIMPMAEVEQFKKIADVKSAAGAMFTTLEDTGSNNPLSSEFIIGLPPENSQDLMGNVGLDVGRFLAKDDKDKALIGSNVANKFSLKTGDKKTFRGKEYEIVGITNSTQVDQVDNLVILPLTTLQESTKLSGFVNTVILIPNSEDKAQGIADTVKKDFPRYDALSPEDAVNETKRGLLIFNVVILAGAFLAAVVGGFSTLNTMAMAISERTREIGIKKAIGATNRNIVFEYLSESALIGFLGGVVGMILGYGGTVLINLMTRRVAENLEIFTFTPRLAIGALIFATLLGALAGLFPALNAARMNVVKALKEL